MINKIFANTSYYMLARFVPMMMGFFMLPILSRYLTPEDYGLVGLVIVLQTFLPVVMSFRIDTSLYRFYVEYVEKNRKIYIASLSIALFLLASVSLFLIFFIFLEKIIHFVYPNLNKEYYPLFVLGLFTAYFNIFNGFLTNLIRVRQKAQLFMKTQLIIVFISIIITLFEVVYYKRGAYGLLESTLITSCITFVIYFILNIKEFTLAFNIKILKDPLKFSLPLLPHAIFTLAYLYSDRIIMEKYLAIALIGLFIFSTKISDLFKIFATEFQNAFLPHYNISAKKNLDIANNELREVSLLFISLMSFLVLLTSLFSFEIVYIVFDRAYLDIWKFIPLLSFSFLFFSLFKFSNIILFFNKNTTTIALITLFGSFFSVALNITLIPIFHIYGAIFTQICSYLFLFVVTITITNKKYNFYLNMKKISLIIIYILFCLIVSSIVNEMYFELAFFITYLIKLILLIGFIFLILKFKIINYTKFEHYLGTLNN